MKGGEAVRRGIICLLLAAAFLLTSAFMPQGYAFATAEDEPEGEFFEELEELNQPPAVSPTDEVSESDAEYFERVALVPANIDVPEFYKQVKNVAGMYIFTMPDGTVHKRIYGALHGEFGWYIPVGSKNVVPINAEPIDIWDDIEMYNKAMEKYSLEQAGKQQGFNGLLPPEDKTSGLTAVFGYDVMRITIISAAAVVVLCIAILIGSAIAKKNSGRNNVR